MVLETTYVTPTGTAVVVDALAMGEGNRGHALGRDAPHLLLRQIRCDHGEVTVDVDYVPRPEYGLVAPLFDAVDGGLRATGGADSLMLSCPTPMIVESSSASVQLSLREGRASRLRAASPQAGRRGSGADLGAGRDRGPGDDTIAAWQSWSDLHQAYVGPWHDLVHHSGRVLQALSFQPTGAICAAPTTSLPESIGGTRNWDYRYSWVRDASLTIEALWVAACPDEANEFFDYITDVGRRVARRRRRPADHVRHRRRTRPDRAGAAAPAGLARVIAGARRQRRVAPTSARRLRGAPERGAPPVGPSLRPRRPGGTTGRPGQVGGAARARAEHATVPRRARRHRRRRGGRRRTTASGRCAANRSTSCTRS